MEKLPNLRVLYASNNKLSSWADIEKVSQLPKLEELLLAGNPLYNDYRDRAALPEYRIEVRQPSPVIPACACACCSYGPPPPRTSLFQVSR